MEHSEENDLFKELGNTLDPAIMDKIVRQEQAKAGYNALKEIYPKLIARLINKLVTSNSLTIKDLKALVLELSNVTVGELLKAGHNSEKYKEILKEHPEIVEAAQDGFREITYREVVCMVIAGFENISLQEVTNRAKANLLKVLQLSLTKDDPDKELYSMEIKPELWFDLYQKEEDFDVKVFERSSYE